MSDVNSRPDGLNNFFQNVTNKLGDLTANPRAGKRPTQESGDNKTQMSSSDGSIIKGVQLIEENGISGSRKQQPGFTPISYYRYKKTFDENGEVKYLPFSGSKNADGNYEDEVFIKPPNNWRKTEEFFGENSSKWDNNQKDFKFSLQDFVQYNSSKNEIYTSDGGMDANSWESSMDKDTARISNYPGTPDDNEDPVYFGFEVIINTLNSPLLNGEVEKFISQIGVDYDEIGSRDVILDQFKNELSRYFKFNTSVVNSQPLMNTGGYNRKYYVKKITGLSKLIEQNGPKTPKSFSDYGSDNITITFYEDITLNLGTLASLYKLLYWSRLRGKSLIPENLLRFDCEIIVSELRNMAQIKKSGDLLNELKANLSRYRYELYECQLFFKSMTHPDSIDLSSAPTSTSTYEVEMSFKYSNMRFERYNPKVGIDDGNNYYTSLGNDLVSGIGPNGYFGTKQIRTYDNISSDIEENRGGFSNGDIESLKSEEKDSVIKRTGDRLLQNLKTAALREAQRRMNDQFRLLNNSIDNIRNSFGIGRMRSPTNVYDNIPGNRFFFDVQNSLRSFAGDTLTGFIGGGG